MDHPYWVLHGHGNHPCPVSLPSHMELEDWTEFPACRCRRPYRRPLAGGLTGALGDLIGAILFPVGPYFPGFTLSSFLDGYIYGLIFRRSLSRKAILLAVFLTQIGVSLVLNTYWLSVLFHTPMMNLLYPRLFQCAVGVVTKTVLLSIVLPPLKKRLSLL